MHCRFSHDCNWDHAMNQWMHQRSIFKPALLSLSKDQDAMPSLEGCSKQIEEKSTFHASSCLMKPVDAIQWRDKFCDYLDFTH